MARQHCLHHNLQTVSVGGRKACNVVRASKSALVNMSRTSTIRPFTITDDGDADDGSMGLLRGRGDADAPRMKARPKYNGVSLLRTKIP
jgi:hypothetical protein